MPEASLPPGILMRMTTPPLERSVPDGQLQTVFERARTMGFLGPGPLRAHLDHARRYLDALRTLLPGSGPHRVLDLGSGGGLPGLPLALWRVDLSLTLLDAGAKRCDFLRGAADELNLWDRVAVLEGRAEQLARMSAHRGRFDVVVSRGFGPPAFTLECALGFLRPHGHVVISEPPVRRAWPTLEWDECRVVPDDQFDGLIVLALEGDLPDAFPRTLQRQRREPLFTLPGV